MMWKHPLFVLCGSILMGPVLLLSQTKDRSVDGAVLQAVEASFPKLKPTENSSPDEVSGGDPAVCAVVFSRNSDGSPARVVAGYHGNSAEIARLAYEHGAARILDAVTDREFSLDGEFCSLSIVNLADPAHPASPLEKTVRVAYGGRDELDWYFVWDGTKLRNITALEHEPGFDLPNSAMPESEAVDIDHEGAMQIVSLNGDGDKFPREDDGLSASPTRTLFRYNGTGYAPVRTLLSFREFTPQPPHWSESMNGSWNDLQRDEIEMHQTPASDYLLTIVNGDRNSRNRVSSAVVQINGMTVVTSAEMQAGPEKLTRTIHLQKKNEIKVVVKGQSGSHLYLMVESLP